MNEIDEKSLAIEIAKLTEVANKLYRRQSPWAAFVTGMIYSMGYFIGILLVVTIIAFILRKLPLIPMIGNWLGAVLNEALSNVKPQQIFTLFK